LASKGERALTRLLQAPRPVLGCGQDNNRVRLICIKHRAAARGHTVSVRHFIFRCPVTGLNVQGSVVTSETEAHYIAHTCLACGGTHLVNPLSGKLMSEEHPPIKRGEGPV
jgi:hypothetical protein